MKSFPPAALAPALFLIVACADRSAPESSPSDAFLAALSTHCGQAFEGAVVSTDDVDAGFAAERLVMHVRECEPGAIRVPFHVGDDRSRTWVITRTADGLRLKHDHRHEDGEEDAVTQYGGDASAENVSQTDERHRAEFPVDAFSIEMFEREGLTASVTNIWAVEIDENELFAYELRRENRFFRVEFDLSAPVEAPPAPWGAEG